MKNPATRTYHDIKTIKEDDQREHDWLELSFDLGVLHLIDKGDSEFTYVNVKFT